MPRLAPVAALAVLLAACSGGDGGTGTRRGAGETPPEGPSSTAPESVGGIAALRTEVDGVVADLLGAEREAGRLTVVIRFRNTSEETRQVQIPASYDTAWRLMAGDRRWPLAREDDGDPAASAPPDRALKPGQSTLWRGTFEAPPPGVDAFRLEVPGVGVFEAIPITDVE